jgi:hypothetical protein
MPSYEGRILPILGETTEPLVTSGIAERRSLQPSALILRRFAGGETMWLTKGDKTDVIIVVVTALVLFAGSC